MSLKLSLLSYQAEFIEAQKHHLYCAFVGGVGSGKSYTLAIGAFLDALHSPDATIGIYGPTVAHVRDVCMAYILKLLAQHGFIKEKDYTVNKNEMKIISQHPQIGSFVFKTMDDPTSIIGYQTYTAHVDELDTMDADKAEAAFYAVMARTRQWPEGLDQDYMTYNRTLKCYEPRNKVSIYTTPEGFKFVYKTWAKSTDPEYKIVKGRTIDNHFNASSYHANMLKKYPGPLAKAYLEGEFVNLTSGSVYYAYNRESFNSEETIRPGEPLHIGMDFNVNHMAARVFVQRHSAAGESWHCVAELDDVLDTPDIINIIRVRWPNHQINVYPDASGRARKTTNASSSDISLLSAAGFTVKARAKNPPVKDRVAAGNNAFMNRKVFVNAEECPRTVECLEQQAYNKNGEPSKESGHDHGNDAFSYFCYYKLPIRQHLFSVPIKWAI